MDYKCEIISPFRDYSLSFFLRNNRVYWREGGEAHPNGYVQHDPPTRAARVWGGGAVVGPGGSPVLPPLTLGVAG